MRSSWLLQMRPLSVSSFSICARLRNLKDAIGFLTAFQTARYKEIVAKAYFLHRNNKETLFISTTKWASRWKIHK